MEENQMLEKDFKEVFKDIKNEILNAQYDIYKSANRRNKGITLIALVITTIFSYDENVKSSNNKGFLL